MIIVKDTCALRRHFLITLDNYWDMPKRHQNEVLQNSIDYLFKFTSANTFRNYLKNISGSNSVVTAQKSLLSKGQIVKDLKIHLLQKSAGVKPIDVGKSKRIYSLLTDKQTYNLQKLSEKSILSKHELDNLIISCIDECKVYTRKFINKKMSFLLKTKKHTLTGIYTDLMIEGIQALLFTYPRFKCDLHAVNIMKATIANAGQNYIESHTRKKRNLYSDSHTIKFTSLFDENENIANTLFCDSNGLLITESENSDLEDMVTDVTAKYKGRKAKIIHLLSGVYDEGFTSYLIEKNITKHANDIYFEHASMDKYIKHIFMYLDYPFEKGNLFIDKLRRKLKDIS